MTAYNLREQHYSAISFYFLTKQFYLQVSEWYDLVIYTASNKDKATKITDYLDSDRGILKKRFYRQVSFAYI